jgi:hypothetical protein
MEVRVDNELYTPSWDIFRDRHTAERWFIEVRMMDCRCGHKALSHVCHTYKHYDGMLDSVVFAECNRECSCRMFKRDNLKWLEKLANDKAKIN